MRAPLFTYTRVLRALKMVASGLVFTVIVGFSFPTVLAINIERERGQKISGIPGDFPVTVDPKNKSIVENEHVNALLEGSDSPLQAAALNTSTIASRVFTLIATFVADLPLYQSLAAVDGRFVTITPGMRKEQVASAFGSTLRWSSTQEKAFLTPTGGSLLPLPEGSFAPGTYLVDGETTPLMAQAFVNDKFSADILARYGTTTAAVVPLTQALTIASLIEREAGGPDDMRLISGIIWNRLFLGMNLQIDATLQYVKANAAPANGWWQKVVPADRSRKSVYNTYMHKGLPPTPIASPSVASVIAALNPKNTSCIFYFHDRYGGFHCSETYAGHVQMLKQHYGQGR